MSHIIKRLQSMLDIFVRVTAAVTCITAVYIGIFWGVETRLTVNILWQILSVSAFSTLGSLLLPCGTGREISKKSMLLRMVVYYIFVNAVVLVCGFTYEWFYLSSWRMVLGMEVCIILVFAAVTGASYFSEYKTAEQMNQRLRERGKTGK